MTPQHDREPERDGALGNVEGESGTPGRERRAPKISVGDASSAQDRKADSSSMKQVRTTFIFLASCPSPTSRTWS